MLVRNFQDGIYVLLTLEGEGGMVKEIERRLRVNEPVIKFLTVRVDEEQKRLAKVKAIRDTKVRGKGTRAAAAAEAAAKRLRRLPLRPRRKRLRPRLPKQRPRPRPPRSCFTPGLGSYAAIGVLRLRSADALLRSAMTTEIDWSWYRARRRIMADETTTTAAPASGDCG